MSILGNQYYTTGWQAKRFSKADLEETGRVHAPCIHGVFSYEIYSNWKYFLQKGGKSTQDQKARKAVEYVSGRLIYDNFYLTRKNLSKSDYANNLKLLANSLEASLSKLLSKSIFSNVVLLTQNLILQQEPAQRNKNVLLVPFHE
jgi:hypothetical protein